MPEAQTILQGEIAAARVKTNAAKTSVETNADRAWKAAAYEAVLQTARELTQFCAYHVWERLVLARGREFAFNTTRYNCAMSALINKAQAADLIVKGIGNMWLPRGGPGRKKSTEGHMCDQPIWVSKICETDGKPELIRCPTCNDNRFMKEGACQFCKVDQELRG